MFGLFKKKINKKVEINKKPITNFDDLLDTLRHNEISITLRNTANNEAPQRSKIGGSPAVPATFEWPRFEGENYNGEIANRPLSFLCQINLEETRDYDKDKLLPEKGLLLFFYEQDTMRWGFSPEDRGCSRVYYFENTNDLELAEFPDDLKDEYKVKEYNLSFSTNLSYPGFEELNRHSNVDCTWSDYDDALEEAGYNLDLERHKLLGYANLIQDEMLTECECTSRGMNRNTENYYNAPIDAKEDINKSATDWILLFQMASITDNDFELMFGDLGNLYFYIRKQDLKEHNFDKVWLVSQCG